MISMNKKNDHPGNYLLAVILGAIIGGIAAVLITKAVPKIMRSMMPMMMAKMKECCADSGCDGLPDT
jgi:hypothetical protein